VNILKVRNDTDKFEFPASSGADGKFSIDGSTSCPSWLGPHEFYLRDLRQGIEPWLTALFQSEHLSLLTGTGLSIAIGKIAGATATGMTRIEFTAQKDVIEKASATSAGKAGRGVGNVEDQFRVAFDILRALEMFVLSDNSNKTVADSLRNELKVHFADFANSVLKGERDIISAEEPKRTIAFNCLVSFLMSFASRTGTRDRLNIFTTNYDRLIEAGAELAGLHLLDRFVGNLTPIFRSSRLDLDLHYNPPGIRGEPRYLEGVARLTKLHGSLDWVQMNEDIRRVGLPFGASDISPYLNLPGIGATDANTMMIYPNAAKDRETAEHPYVELFRDFAAAICRPNSTLVTYGYGFGDEHVNRAIVDMLTIPSTHLVVISYDDPYERIMKLFDAKKDQMSLLIGPDLASIKNLTEYFLPKSAIDKASYRLGDILLRRWGKRGADESADSSSTDNTGGSAK